MTAANERAAAKWIPARSGKSEAGTVINTPVHDELMQRKYTTLPDAERDDAVTRGHGERPFRTVNSKQ